MPTHGRCTRGKTRRKPETNKCVGSYAQRYAEGKTVLCCLRRVSALDTRCTLLLVVTALFTRAWIETTELMDISLSN